MFAIADRFSTGGLKCFHGECSRVGEWKLSHEALSLKAAVRRDASAVGPEAAATQARVRVRSDVDKIEVP
jgi:hypothetical protein